MRGGNGAFPRLWTSISLARSRLINGIDRRDQLNGGREWVLRTDSSEIVEGVQVDPRMLWRTPEGLDHGMFVESADGQRDVEVPCQRPTAERDRTGSTRGPGAAAYE